MTPREQVYTADDWNTKAAHAEIDGRFALAARYYGYSAELCLTEPGRTVQRDKQAAAQRQITKVS